MKLSLKKIQILIDYFKPLPIKAVYVFGSWAREDADKKSDIDIILDPDFDAISTPINIPQYRRDLKKLLFLNIDIFQLHKLLKYWKPSVLEESILIYKK